MLQHNIRYSTHVRWTFVIYLSQYGVKLFICDKKFKQLIIQYKVSLHHSTEMDDQGAAQAGSIRVSYLTIVYFDLRQRYSWLFPKQHIHIAHFIEIILANNFSHNFKQRSESCQCRMLVILESLTYVRRSLLIFFNRFMHWHPLPYCFEVWAWGRFAQWCPASISLTGEDSVLPSRLWCDICLTFRSQAII